MKIVLALGLALSSATLAAQPAKAPAAAAAAACDRECLRGKVSEVLYALVDHDMARLPVATACTPGVARSSASAPSKAAPSAVATCTT